ncbi:MAG: hypothetical protein ACRD1Z_03470, partial [Vicinamibacteria bacterium]
MAIRGLLPWALVSLVAGISASAEPFVSTLRLDSFSILSFGDQEVFQFPKDAEIRFEFSSESGDGSLGFVVRPSKALIAPIPLRYGDESLELALAQTANGAMKMGTDGRLIVEIDAYVIVTLNHPEDPGWKKLPIHLTTESTQAKSLEGDHVIDVSGGRVSGRGVQLVGTTTNAEDDYPRPGA